MPPPATFKSKIKNALRIDRAFLLVWKASRKWTFLSICLTVIEGVIPLLTLYIMKLIVDTIADAVQTGDASGSLRHVVYLILAATVVAVLQSAIRLVSGYVAEAQGAVVTDYVTRMVHDKSLSLDLAYYENPSYYDTLHRAQREGAYRPTRIVTGLTGSLQNAVSLTAMVGLLFLFHWGVGVLLFISVLPGIFVQMLHARKRFAWQKEHTSDERRAMYFSNVLTLDVFAKEIRLFDLGGYFSRLFDEIRSLLRGEKLALARSRGVADFCTQTFAAIVLMGSLVLIAYRALSGAITIGDMVMFFQAFQRGVGYLKDLLFQVAGLYEDNMFVANFFEFLDIESEVNDPAVPLQIPAEFEQGIALAGVHFKYPGEREPVLKNVSLTIRPGEVVAIVGANGAGKSTLVKLLCRLYDPQQGTISLDGIELSRFAQKDLRRQMSVVFQDFARYYLTVRQNIWLGDIDLAGDSTRIEEAGGKAGVDTFIKKLPKGYDTALGRWFHEGEELSLGEWQKIVLARAFLRDAQFIILDEPTSSMDVNTEYYLYKKFRELIAGRSALIISHRFSTVRMADKIYVLEDGAISESGSHRQLMERQGTYAEMYRKQAAWMEGAPCHPPRKKL
jgi:ATP-binding cassette subfamily B protein